MGGGWTQQLAINSPKLARKLIFQSWWFKCHYWYVSFREWNLRLKPKCPMGLEYLPTCTINWNHSCRLFQSWPATCVNHRTTCASTLAIRAITIKVLIFLGFFGRIFFGESKPRGPGAKLPTNIYKQNVPKWRTVFSGLTKTVKTYENITSLRILTLQKWLLFRTQIPAIQVQTFPLEGPMIFLRDVEFLTWGTLNISQSLNCLEIFGASIFVGPKIMRYNS